MKVMMDCMIKIRLAGNAMYQKVCNSGCGAMDSKKDIGLYFIICLNGGRAYKKAM